MSAHSALAGDGGLRARPGGLQRTVQIDQCKSAEAISEATLGLTLPICSSQLITSFNERAISSPERIDKSAAENRSLTVGELDWTPPPTERERNASPDLQGLQLVQERNHQFASEPRQLSLIGAAFEEAWLHDRG